MPILVSKTVRRTSRQLVARFASGIVFCLMGLATSNGIAQTPATFTARLSEMQEDTAIGTFANSPPPIQEQRFQQEFRPPGGGFSQPARQTVDPHPALPHPALPQLPPPSTMDAQASPWRYSPAVPAIPAGQASSTLSSPPTESVQFNSNQALPVGNNPNGVARSGAPAGNGYGNSIFSGQRPSQPQSRRFDNSAAQAFNQANPIRQVGFDQSISNSAGNLATAKQLMQRYSVNGARNGALPGEPLRLVEMFRQPIPRGRRNTMVDYYWQTYRDWAMLVSAQRHRQWLSQVNVASPPGDRDLLAAAKMMAANQVLASEIQLMKSQSQLVQLLPNRRSSLLPLPSDQPMTDEYTTHYDQYRAKNLLPAKLVGMDQILAKTLELIGGQATSVELSKRAANENLSAMSTRQSSIVAVLESARIWHQAEQELIAAVMSYNQSIAVFSLTVKRGSQSPEQLVAMLIGEPGRSTSESVVVDRSFPSGLPSNIAIDTSRNSSDFGFTQPANSLPVQPVSHSTVAPATPVTNLPTLPVGTLNTQPTMNPSVPLERYPNGSADSGFNPNDNSFGR